MVNPYSLTNIKRKEYGLYRRRESLRYFKQWKSQGCYICGYIKCLDALGAHHKDGGNEKYHKLKGSFKGRTKRMADLDPPILKRELQKCICLCANCHAEVHAGLHKKILDMSDQIQKEERNKIKQLGLF